MKHFLEFYTLVALLTVLFLYFGHKEITLEQAFFKSLGWPAVVCDHIPLCKEKLF